MDIKGIHDVYRLRAPQGQARPAHRAEEAVSARPGQGGDVVEISPDAALRAKLAPSRAAAQEGPDARRLEALRRKYLGDACPVSGRDVARAMLERTPAGEDGSR